MAKPKEKSKQYADVRIACLGNGYAMMFRNGTPPHHNNVSDYPKADVLVAHTLDEVKKLLQEHLSLNDDGQGN